MVISSTPKLFSFAGNPMRYQLSSEPSSGNINSVVKFRFSDIDTTVGHAFTIRQNGVDRTFTLISNPSDPNDFPVASTGYPPDYWAYLCYMFIKDDVQLSTDYDISLDETDIVFTAKIPSPDYDIEEVSSNVNGLQVSTVVGGELPPTGTVEGVLMQIFKNGTTLIGEEYKPIETSGIVRFDVAEYIYAHLLLSPPPRFHNSLTGNTLVYSDYICQYEIRFTDRINNVFQPRVYVDGLRYAIAGGLNREELVSTNENSLDFFSLAAIQEKWLTWWEGTKITDQVSKESLFFAFQAPVDYSKYSLIARIYDASGNYQIVQAVPLTSIVPFSVVEFSVGYAELGISSYFTGNAVKWDVCLKNETGTKISDYFEFQLDPIYRETTRYFRFRNSWGVYDSIRCTGIFELKLEHSRETSTFISEETETPYNSPKKITFSQESQVFKANTGFVPIDTRQFLRDFERSFDVYEYSEGRLYPINLTSKKSNLLKDKEYNYFLEFEYERAYTDFFFSRMMRAIIKKAYSGDYSSDYS